MIINKSQIDNSHNNTGSKPRPYALLSGSIALSLSMMMTVSAHAASNGMGDLEIYKAPEAGAPTFTMMLDTSGSMGTTYLYQEYGDLYGYESRGYLYNLCQAVSPETKSYTYKDNATNKTFTVKLDLQGCFKKSNDKNAIGDYRANNKIYKLSRLTILQMSLLELLTTQGKIDSKTRLGMGQFSLDGQGKAGVINFPAKALSFEHRQNLANYVKNVTATGGTPTSFAFAEAGAYMMGTSTVQPPYLKVVANRTISYGYYIYSRCSSSYSVINQPTVTENGIKAEKLQNCYSYDNGSYNSNYLPDFDGTITQGNTRFYLKLTESDGYSGFRSSANSTKSTSNNTQYEQGAMQAQCAGNGIYLLTDGEPSSVNSSDISSFMDTTLQETNLSVESCSGNWDCMFKYAQQLKKNTNPANLSIKTATVGFGKAFAGLDTTQTNGKIVYDCDTSGANSDTQSLCKLGKEHGGGGFYYAQSADDIAQSVSSFLESLSGEIEAAPSGTITIPNDPLSASNLQPFAYLPMIEAKVAETNYVWPGNLKKYNVYQGTLYGKSSKFPLLETARLYVDEDGDGFPDDMSKSAQDLWSTGDKLDKSGAVANNSIHAGGVFAQLKAPNSASPDATRNVFVESDNKLVNIKVTAGEIVGFDQLDNSYGVREKLYLLAFLGYEAPMDKVSEISGLNATQQLARYKTIVSKPPKDALKVLGGVVHSKPRQVSYGAKFLANGEISNNESDRDDYIMFGSMDGALHLVESEKGQETFAFIPKLIIKEQVKALQVGSEGSIGRTVFGVDAPWNSRSELEYDFSSAPGKVKATEVTAYGGLRMGGKAIYGLDLKDKDTPKLLFAKTSSDSGFERLGQVWSEPTLASIKVKGSGNKFISKDVVIVSGGYDACYEDASFTLKATGTNTNCSNKTVAEGNAIYILDGANGNILASVSGASSGTNHTKVDTMKHSVVGGVTALDRDDDGNVEHLYYADLGGNVYRVDLNSGATTSKLVNRVVRVFNASAGEALPYRFYERPVVSFYTSPYQEIFASVVVASGDRSSPLSMLRKANNPDQLFNVFDYDIAQPSVFRYSTAQLLTKDKVPSDLASLPFTKNAKLKDLGSRKSISEAIAKATYNDTTKRYVYDYAGWSYPLNYFDGYSKVAGVKSMGEPLAYGNRLLITAYSPEMVYDSTNSCSAQVVGGSERQLYCMPYGVCDKASGTSAASQPDSSSIDGTAGYTRAGKGIQELALGAYSKDQRDVKMLIGNESLQDQLKTTNRHGAGVGSGGLDNTRKAGLKTVGNSIIDDGSTTGGKSGDITKTDGKSREDGIAFNERFRLLPKRWYEHNEND